jgi:hypothetical protein
VGESRSASCRDLGVAVGVPSFLVIIEDEMRWACLPAVGDLGMETREE